ncbi:MAG: response regulator [Alphaproteobacteria bacterium]|nr:response regulator [Alphaproteobacteria bacterium]
MARILLAEDDESMRTFLERALERVGHEVISVADGFAALPHIANMRFDLLLTDIVMPGMDGLELARRASIEMSGIQDIFITGFAAVALNNNAPRHPNARVLSKPLHLRSLVDEIERVLQPA